MRRSSAEISDSSPLDDLRVGVGLSTSFQHPSARRPLLSNHQSSLKKQPSGKYGGGVNNSAARQLPRVKSRLKLNSNSIPGEKSTDEMVAGIDKWAAAQSNKNSSKENGNESVTNHIRNDINEKLLEFTPEMIEARRLDSLASKQKPRYEMSRVETGLFSSTLVLRETENKEIS